MILGRHDHVGGLDVAVNEPLLVGHLERRGDLSGGQRGSRRAPADRPRESACRARCPRPIASTMKTVPSSSPASYSGTTLGWSSEATVLASRRRRSRITGSRATVGLDQLQRDRPVEPQLTGAVEDPDPAEADDALDLVAAELGAREKARALRGRARRSSPGGESPLDEADSCLRSGRLLDARASRIGPEMWRLTSLTDRNELVGDLLVGGRGWRAAASLVRTAQRHQYAALGGRQAHRVWRRRRARVRGARRGARFRCSRSSLSRGAIGPAVRPESQRRPRRSGGVCR